MSSVAKTSQKKRTHKVSRGIHGASHHPLTEVQKVILGKGLMRTIKHVNCLRAWRGAGVINEPYDAKTVLENRRLYPHLFMED